jgi:hypothetical protein
MLARLDEGWQAVFDIRAERPEFRVEEGGSGLHLVELLVAGLDGGRGGGDERLEEPE